MLEHIEIAVAFSLLGAMAHLSSLHLSGCAFSPVTLAANLTLSLFAAALTYLIALRLGWQVYGVGFGCGISAWVGEKMLVTFEGILSDKIRSK